MSPAVEDALRKAPLYRYLQPEDLTCLAAVARAQAFAKGQTIFREGAPSDCLHSIVSGRVKVVKRLPSGKEVILEIFGGGDPLGAVVAYEGRPYPASAVAVEKTLCIIIDRRDFFELLASRPTLVRGYLVGLTRRIVELTRRMTEIAGGRVESRLARIFVTLAEKAGQGRPEGVFVPIRLSRQDLADLTCTTIETAIRLMTRWGRQDVVRTQKGGFLIVDRVRLERLAQGKMRTQGAC